jgi:hypothetical protein
MTTRTSQTSLPWYGSSTLDIDDLFESQVCTAGMLDHIRHISTSDVGRRQAPDLRRGSDAPADDPPHLQHRDLPELQRQHLAAQPWLGLGGLLLAAIVFFALALGTGSTATSLLILGPISTFALPVVAMVAF